MGQFTVEKRMESDMKTKILLMAVSCVAVLFFGCRASPQDLIVGKWEAGDSGVKITAEFAKDGQAKLTMFGQTLRGTYKLNGDELEWTMNGITTKAKVKLTATDMELTSDGKTIKYQKV
jgi:hypothetical protein